MRLRFLRSLTIRNKLLLFCVCIVVFTALSISGATALVASRNARHRAVAQLESVATLKEQEVDSWAQGLSLNLDIVLSGQDIAHAMQTLTVARPGTGAYDRAHAVIRRRFLWASTTMKLFEELFFMGPKGEVLVSTDTGHEHQQLGMNDYFMQGRKGEFIQEPSYSLSLRTMTVVASCPVTFDGVAIGVLAGRTDLRSLNTLMLGRAGLGETGETYLVGTNHRLLTGLRRPGYAVPDTYIRTAGANAAVDRAVSGSGTYAGYATGRVIGVYEWIPRLKVGLLAEQGEGEALHATRVALMTAGGLVLVAAVVAILAAIVLVHSIVRPLDELGETAGRIAGGELDLTADASRHDEIGRLAQAFNRMTGSLRELAAANERQRLARDLHDAVSQTLFSVSLIAEVLPRVFERDPAQGRERLDELRQLTRGALAEMRILLLELRPATIAESNLRDLLRQLSEAIVGRWRIPVELRLDTDREIPPEVAVAMYRIAQEALNNVAKHSHAEQATLSLRDCRTDGRDVLELVVRDDGVGFDPDDAQTGRLGLTIMRERAESVGAELEIRSARGSGTLVRVLWHPSSEDPTPIAV